MLVIDNCKYCGAITPTRYKKLPNLVTEILNGNEGCWLCCEDDHHHKEIDIFRYGKKVWCGHSGKCEDI